MSKINTVIVVAYPDRGEGNDPELFFFLGGWVIFHNQGSTFLLWAIYNNSMRVMICLGQGGLCSLSASSLIEVITKLIFQQKPITCANK